MNSDESTGHREDFRIIDLERPDLAPEKLFRRGDQVVIGRTVPDGAGLSEEYAVLDTTVWPPAESPLPSFDPGPDSGGASPLVDGWEAIISPARPVEGEDLVRLRHAETDTWLRIPFGHFGDGDNAYIGIDDVIITPEDHIWFVGSLLYEGVLVNGGDFTTFREKLPATLVPAGPADAPDTDGATDADGRSELVAFAAALPEPRELERRFRALGIIEAILTDHDFRYSYSQTFLGRSHRVGRYDNGAGDLVFAFFSDDGSFVRAFDHEDETSPHATGELWPGLLDGLPEQLQPFVVLPELEDDTWEEDGDPPSITLALWSTGDGWTHGNPGPDGSGSVPGPTNWMFTLVAGDFTAGVVAENLGQYFGTAIDPTALEPILESRPLTRDRVRALNPDSNWDVLHEVAERSGYPTEF